MLRLNRYGSARVSSNQVLINIGLTMRTIPWPPAFCVEVGDGGGGKAVVGSRH
jgi:hypothetical protein